MLNFFFSFLQPFWHFVFSIFILGNLFFFFFLASPHPCLPMPKKKGLLHPPSTYLLSSQLPSYPPTYLPTYAQNQMRILYCAKLVKRDFLDGALVGAGH